MIDSSYRFGSVEKASAFKEAVDEAERVNTAILEKQAAEGEGETKEAAEETPAAETEAAADTEETPKTDDSEADALADKLESTAKVAEE